MGVIDFCVCACLCVPACLPACLPLCVCVCVCVQHIPSPHRTFNPLKKVLLYIVKYRNIYRVYWTSFESSVKYHLFKLSYWVWVCTHGSWKCVWVCTHGSLFWLCFVFCFVMQWDAAISLGLRRAPGSLHAAVLLLFSPPPHLNSRPSRPLLTTTPLPSLAACQILSLPLSFYYFLT